MSAEVSFFHDHIAHYLIDGLAIRALEVQVRDTARESVARIEASDVAANSVAQLLAGVGLLAAHIKGDERLSVNIAGSGSLGGLLADVTAEGDMRARVQYPAAAVSTAGSSTDDARQVRAQQEKEALGRGQIVVIKSTPTRELYRGTASFGPTQIAGALATYLEVSEQVESLLWTASQVEEGTVSLARGLLLQELGGGDREWFRAFQKTVDRQAIQQQLEAGAPVQSLLEGLFAGHAVKEVDVRPLRFQCRCSDERIFSMLLSLGSDELRDMLEQDGKAEITCDFCMTRYDVDGSQLRALLQLSEAENPSQVLN